MKKIIEEICEATNNSIGESDVAVRSNNEVYTRIRHEDVEALAEMLFERGYKLVSLFCAEGFEDGKRLTLFYVFEKHGIDALYFFFLPLENDVAFSIDSIYPSASWYQREVTEGFGVRFDGAYDERRLFLHEAYPKEFHPLKKEFVNKAIKTVDPNEADAYQFMKVSGEGVYEVPVGPVHAGIIEPGHFRFSVIGENMHHLEVRMFYKHRGIEKLAENKTPGDAVKIAESISGDESIANSFAYCNTIEKICEANVPARAMHIRTVLLEMERVYSHLGDIAGMAVDVAFPVGANPLFILREEILRQNKELTGSRFMKDIICVGGLKRDVPDDKLKNLERYLENFSKRFVDAVKFIEATPSLIDRFETTGIVKKELISPLHITGPVARACGAKTDSRINHPYGLYDKSAVPEVMTASSDDVLGRFQVKSKEIKESIRLIKKMIREMPGGRISAEYSIRDGYAATIIEAPRGETFFWVLIKNGKIDRFKVRTASYCNWQCIQHAVIGNIVPDFPLINKSMNLSYAGTDL